MSDSTQSREHYRLRYPLQARPRLVMNGTDFTVTEISESGCRVVCNAEQSSPFISSPDVTFSFHDGTRLKTTATLLRLAEEEVVLKLIPSIPLTVIIAEQHWVIRKFPRERPETES